MIESPALNFEVSGNEFIISDVKMAFKLPYFTKKAIVNKVTDLPQFRNEDLEEIGIVGRGSFGVVVKAKHLVHGYVSDPERLYPVSDIRRYCRVTPVLYLYRKL